MTRFTAACVQLRATRSIETNIAEAVELIREAAGRGADFVQTPETTNLIELDRKRLFGLIREEEEDASLPQFKALATELGIWLHIGSMAFKVGEGKAANRGFLIGPDGAIAARYDKIHMFDVDLAGGESYRESSAYRPGETAVVADLPWARFGMSICYDMRFPDLYRAQARAGAQVLTAPAAFTRQTGEAHWHLLLRARAVENGCFMIAAAQGGTHDSGRQTYGHSLIVDPWGEILAEAGTEPGVVTAEIDLERVAEIRGRVPSLANERAFELVEPASPPLARTA